MRSRPSTGWPAGERCRACGGPTVRVTAKTKDFPHRGILGIMGFDACSLVDLCKRCGTPMAKTVCTITRETDNG